MNKICLIIVVIQFLFTDFSYSQKNQQNNFDCLTINSFQLKCEKGLNDIKTYLNDSILLDSDHVNIMYCYNQLHWDILGESIERLSYREVEKSDSSIIVCEERLTNEQIMLFSKLFESYKSLYTKYVEKLLMKYESSYGLGGALYINSLNTYPSTANGKTYFVLCK